MLALSLVVHALASNAHAQELSAEDVSPPPSEDAPAPQPTVDYRVGRGITFSSRDGDFELNVGGRAQVLGQLDIGRDAMGDRDAEFDLSFRRARIAFTGHAFGPDVRYKVELAFSDRDRGMRDGVARFSPILDAYLDLRHLRDLNVRIGQFKVPFSRQRVISSSRLQMVDRSIVNAELNVDRDFGLVLSSGDLFGLGVLRYAAGVYMGEGRDYLPGIGLDDTGLLYTARVEVLPFGMFDDYEEADNSRSPDPRLSVGMGYAFSDDSEGNRGILGSTPLDGGTTDYHFATLDAVFMVGGFSAFTEAILRWGTRNPGDATDEDGEQLPTEAPRNGIGWMLQAGYLLPWIDLEINGRYGMNIPFGGPDLTSMPERNEMGLGLSYYFDDHVYKVQLDVFHLWGEMDRFGAGEDRVRLSLQGYI